MLVTVLLLLLLLLLATFPASSSSWLLFLAHLCPKLALFPPGPSPMSASSWLFIWFLLSLSGPPPPGSCSRSGSYSTMPGSSSSALVPPHLAPPPLGSFSSSTYHKSCPSVSQPAIPLTLLLVTLPGSCSLASGSFSSSTAAGYFSHL